MLTNKLAKQIKNINILSNFSVFRNNLTSSTDKDLCIHPTVVTPIMTFFIILILSRKGKMVPICKRNGKID
jgi:hypothetical protein